MRRYKALLYHLHHFKRKAEVGVGREVGGEEEEEEEEICYPGPALGGLQCVIHIKHWSVASGISWERGCKTVGTTPLVRNWRP